MKKLYLEDVIEKYHLNGLVERVKIQITDKTLTTKFISTQKNLVGTIEAPNVELQDCEFGIYDTSQLLKLIGITDHFLILGIEMQGKVANKLTIADNEYNLEYALADTMLTPAVPAIEEPVYDMTAEVNTEFISKFLKAKKALDTDVFIIEQSIDVDNKPAMKFTLGGTEKHTNKVNFTLPTQYNAIPGIIVKFPIVEFGEILAANKEPKTSVLSVNQDGLLKIEFENEEGVKSSYILVGRE
jgi:hypothetical protein